MDERAFFEIEDEVLAADQAAFLATLRLELRGLRPYCVWRTEDSLLLVLDIDAPDLALVNVGLEFRGRILRGDRISVHDHSFPPSPTADGFLVEGSPAELASRGAELLRTFSRRLVVKHEWLHRGRVYANCYLFEDSGERLVEMYRTDWAPPGEGDQLIADGFVQGNGWIQTAGLREPDHVVRVRGQA